MHSRSCGSWYQWITGSWYLVNRCLRGVRRVCFQDLSPETENEESAYRYVDDVDLGYRLTFSGSGGRNLKGTSAFSTIPEPLLTSRLNRNCEGAKESPHCTTNRRSDVGWTQRSIEAICRDKETDSIVTRIQGKIGVRSGRRLSLRRTLRCYEGTSFYTSDFQ